MYLVYDSGDRNHTTKRFIENINCDDPFECASEYLDFLWKKKPNRKKPFKSVREKWFYPYEEQGKIETIVFYQM